MHDNLKTMKLPVLFHQLPRLLFELSAAKDLGKSGWFGPAIAVNWNCDSVTGCFTASSHVKETRNGNHIRHLNCHEIGKPKGSSVSYQELVVQRGEKGAASDCNRGAAQTRVSPFPGSKKNSLERKSARISVLRSILFKFFDRFAVGIQCQVVWSNETDDYASCHPIRYAELSCHTLKPKQRFWANPHDRQYFC